MNLVGKENAGYTIIAQGRKAVIGERDTKHSKFVAWDYNATGEAPSYFWGHYCSTYEQAFESFAKKEGVK